MSPSNGANCVFAGAIFWAVSAFRFRPANRAGIFSKWFGRGPPATSTASSEAIPAKDRRRCCRRKRAPNSRSGSSDRKTRTKSPEAFRAFVKERLPADCRAEFISHGASGALQLPFSSEALSRARRALQAEWGKEPVLAGCGGSIPVVGAFKRDLGMDTLMIGFGLEDDRMHSPNEKYELSSFHKGTRSWARVLNALAL